MFLKMTPLHRTSYLQSCIIPPQLNPTTDLQHMYSHTSNTHRGPMYPTSKAFITLHLMSLSELLDHLCQIFQVFTSSVLTLRVEPCSPQPFTLLTKEIWCLSYAWMTILKRRINSQVKFHAARGTWTEQIWFIPSHCFTWRLYIEKGKDFWGWCMFIQASLFRCDLWDTHTHNHRTTRTFTMHIRAQLFHRSPFYWWSPCSVLFNTLSI